MDREAIKRKFKEYIRKRNLRYTQQREEVIDAFLSLKKHFTVEELYTELKKSNSDIGFATVYRTLKLFNECGLSEAVRMDDGKMKIEQAYGVEHHDHLICLECGKIIEVKSEKIEELQMKLAQENQFIPQKHKLDIYGLCRECVKGI